ARLMGQARLHQSSDSAEPLTVDSSLAAGLRALVEHHLTCKATSRRKLVLYLYGPRGVGKRELALHICGFLGSRLLSIDVEALLTRSAEAETLLRAAFREGLLQRALLLLERGDLLLQDFARPLLNVLAGAISEYGWVVMVSGESPWTLKDAFSACVFHE